MKLSAGSIASRAARTPSFCPRTEIAIARASSESRAGENVSFSFPCCGTYSLFHMHRNSRAPAISYNEASLSKIKQRSRRILAVALFVRMCKQWNYPFPARIYPDDIRPVANLPAGKHSGGFHGYVRIHLYKINKPETFSHRFDALERAASKSPPRNRRSVAEPSRIRAD
jgi:hypothetical protein